MVQDTNLFRNSNIGTRMRERFTNAFSQQDRTLLKLQNKRRHRGHLKFYFFLRETNQCHELGELGSPIVCQGIKYV